MTREQWLQEAARRLRAEIFEPKGHKVPTVRIGLGFPVGRGKENKVTGQCLGSATDKVVEIFISPKIGDSPERIIDVLAHEMIHAMGHWDHRGGFRRVMRSIGLVGKPTATVAGKDFAEWAKQTAKAIGPWPGAKIETERRQKKQRTRLIKVWCPGCGYKMRITRTWIEKGIPTCPNPECEDYGLCMECD